MHSKYKDIALCYAEKYGIIEYTVKGNTMTYYDSYVLERNTYKCTVNLDTMEETRVRLERYYKKHAYNAHG